ncbi:TraV family lipoprotein [Endozoicomonas gorgoniicola]|uniref:TraV family lipoprotein n=1 Tax=Endozoicomonas gorgoniicola TaxID=1234144 RepID=A0ABT3MXD0_9GAMM|nr:TraV family lipoprotein [Endozoicomonas gorgoniicola]MCW7553723.1 TraV family lipoprotein [Endozoicomonas gorgoniicola]
MRCFLEPQRHEGTKKSAIKPFVSLCLCGSALLLSGCSLFGVGEAKYACPEPGKGVCKSARQIYKDTDHSVLEEMTATSMPSVTSHVSPDLSIVTPETVPNRLPAQVLRIWLAPWVDKQGNWHSGGVVMTDIYPREWQSAVPVYSPSDNE